MNKPFSLALVAIGVLLLAYGLRTGSSFASNVKESVAGTPTDKSLWLLVAGVLSLILGGYGLLRGGKS